MSEHRSSLTAGSLPRLKDSRAPRLENGKESLGRLTSVERLQSLKAATFSAAAAVQVQHCPTTHRFVFLICTS